MTACTSLVAVVTLALVHLVTGELRFLAGTSWSVWLSIAGGSLAIFYGFERMAVASRRRRRRAGEGDAAGAGTF